VALPDLLLPLLQASLAAASKSGRAGENPPGLSRELAINAIEISDWRFFPESLLFIHVIETFELWRRLEAVILNEIYVAKSFSRIRLGFCYVSSSDIASERVLMESGLVGY